MNLNNVHTIIIFAVIKNGLICIDPSPFSQKPIIRFLFPQFSLLNCPDPIYISPSSLEQVRPDLKIELDGAQESQM